MFRVFGFRVKIPAPSGKTNLIKRKKAFLFCGSDELTARDSNSCIFLPENFDNPCGSASANK